MATQIRGDVDIKDGTITDAQMSDMAGSKLTGAYTAAGLVLATDRLLGRSTALTGAVEEISVGSGLSLAAGVLSLGIAVPTIQSVGRAVAQAAAVASVATYTNGAADGSFLVSSNVNVITSTAHSFSVQVDYTDETNTARTLTLTLSQLTGALVTTLTNGTGAGPYHGVPVQIRCKASTAITIKTTGTFTTVSYNVEGLIQQVS